MIYKTSDLKNIFIRVNNTSVSLDKVKDIDFVKWLESKFNITMHPSCLDRPWSSEDKVWFLNDESRLAGGAPVVAMLKENQESINLGIKEN